jgi:hypothetical protein
MKVSDSKGRASGYGPERTSSVRAYPSRVGYSEPDEGQVDAVLAALVERYLALIGFKEPHGLDLLRQLREALCKRARKVHRVEHEKCTAQGHATIALPPLARWAAS